MNRANSPLDSGEDNFDDRHSGSGIRFAASTCNKQRRSDIYDRVTSRKLASSSSVESSDDADDEDWIAFENEKRRNNRRNPPIRPPVSHKSISNQSERIRSRYQHSAQRLPTRMGRSGPQMKRTFNRNAQVKSAAPHRGRNSVEQTQQDTSPMRALLSELAKPRQCLGPGCTRAAARPDTKYCSEQCGMKLAIRRLEVLLPKCLRDGCRLDGSGSQTRSIAEELDKKRLEEIQTEKCTLRDKLLQLEIEHQKLTNLIARARESKPDRTTELNLDRDSREAEQMEPVICVTCSSEVSMRHALRHMEKCFQKMEGSTVFCASQKEQVMGTPLFCDTYDNQAKAYCKRLRVVCEHFKEPKLPPDTVCGFPLVEQVFTETGQFCGIQRNKCSRHLGWERLRRAHIDIERYRCLIRMDELMQEEQKLHQSISQRGGLLGILLHQTIDHNPAIPVPLPPELRNAAKCADASGNTSHSMPMNSP